MSRIQGGHRVLGVEHLLGRLWEGGSSVLLRATAVEKGRTDHEQVETDERDSFPTLALLA